MRILFLLILLLLPVQAASSDALAPYQPYISASSERFAVPDRLIKAIMKQESAFNPWAVNVAGQGNMPKTKEEALAIANNAWAEGRSFDVGLMQINSYWLRRFSMNPEYVIDPERNIVIGTWILAQEIKRFGLSWKAVASYHTPIARPERGRTYAASVIRHLKAM